MKKILITGAGSYIGTSVEKWLGRNPDKYEVFTVDMQDDAWRGMDLGIYDVIFHVAGIAHVKETKQNAHLYYEVNEHLAVETAQKAKADGVKQFILLSSMSVYGLTTGHITKETCPYPKTNYGKSKYNADTKIQKLDCEGFKVAILRPPMVYGKGCRGNYQMLRKFALRSPVFPDYKNERSMLYIGNLASFVKRLIDAEEGGLFFPQDREYVCTADMVREISACSDEGILLTGVFNWCVSLMLKMHIGIFEKVFGTLIYEKTDLVDEFVFEEAVRKAEE